MKSYVEKGERWSVLSFDADGVEELMRHSRACEKHRMGFSERIDTYGDWNPRPGEEDRAATTLILVKDEGIYLMSSGIPRLEDPENPDHSKVVYAEGYDPTKADRMEVWNAARAAVGGDDFTECFDVDDFAEPLQAARTKAGRGKVEMHVSENSIRMMSLAEGPVQAAEAAPPREAPVQPHPEETVEELRRVSREKFAGWAAWLLVAAKSPLVEWQGDDFIQGAGRVALMAAQGERVTQKRVTDLLQTYRRFEKQEDSPLNSARRAAMWFLRTFDPKKDNDMCPHNMVTATLRAAVIGYAATTRDVDARREHHGWVVNTMNDAAVEYMEKVSKQAPEDDGPSSVGPDL